MKNKNTGTPPFPFDFCVQQFPFIAEDFDALTMYELVGKVIKYMKDMDKKFTNDITEINEKISTIENDIEAIKEFIHFEDVGGDENGE